MIYKKYVHSTRQSEYDRDDDERTSSMKDTSAHSVQETMQAIRQTKNAMRDSSSKRNDQTIRRAMIYRYVRDWQTCLFKKSRNIRRLQIYDRSRRRELERIFHVLGISNFSWH